MVSVKFVRAWRHYNPGEVAGFTAAVAGQLVEKRYATEVDADAEDGGVSDDADAGEKVAAAGRSGKGSGKKVGAPAEAASAAEAVGEDVVAPEV